MKGTRQRIEAEAEALLTEFGLQFPFKELERRAKVGSGGLRHHFRSMEELVASSTLRQLQPFKDRFDALVHAGQTVDYVLEHWLFHLAE